MRASEVYHVDSYYNWRRTISQFGTSYLDDRAVRDSCIGHVVLKNDQVSKNTYISAEADKRIKVIYTESEFQHLKNMQIRKCVMKMSLFILSKYLHNVLFQSVIFSIIWNIK